MSNLRLLPELFVGVPELSKLVKSLRQNGYITSNKALINNFGVAIHKKLPNSLRVIPGSSGKVTIRAGIAIDSNFNNIIVEQDLVDIATIPDNSTEYFIMVDYNGTNYEKGKVSISPNGTLTGVGTEFLSLFRGEGSRMPTKIRFFSDTKDVINQSEYYISSVQSDTLAYLNVASGVLASESDLNFSIIGSFTPGVVVSDVNKRPYINDSYIITISTSKTSNSSTRFVLASAINNGGIVTIRDMRDENLLSCFDNDTTNLNPIIGVERVYYGSVGSGGLENPVKIGWGLESPQGSWSVDTSGEVSISALEGGRITSLANLGAIDLEGWRVCFPDGKVGLIVGMNNSNGVLKLQTTITSNSVIGPLLITPNCTSVEILAKNTTNHTIVRRVSFDSNMRYGIIPCESGVGIQFSYRMLKGTSGNSPVRLINNGSYYPETSFDDNGNLISTLRQGYTAATIPLKRRVNSIIELFNTLIPIGAVIDFWAMDEASIPENYINCDGRQVSNPSSPLYGIFTPDYRGRTGRGYDPEQPEFNSVGNMVGSKTVTLSEPQLPKFTPQISMSQAGQHSHSATAAGPYVGPNIEGGGGFDGGGNTFKERPVTMQQAGQHTHNLTVGQIGGDQPHNNLGPSITVFKIMRIL